MTIGRGFPVDLLSDRLLDETPWFSDLLRHWRPAGDALNGDEDADRLRLALRDGYLSFYRKGQSIARVAFDRTGALQARIHHKYLYAGGGGARRYGVLTAAGVPDKDTGLPRPYAGLFDIREWLSNSDAYAGNEKDFVDLVVARNPNVVDLEMALPAYADDPDERTSPRMDLVALEPEGGRWRIVFWEAKRVRDGRIRSRGSRVPEVAAQLAQYTTWLRQPGHSESVAAAYQNVCRRLVRLHAIARSLNPRVGDLGPAIVACADGPAPLVDDEPRLLIDNRTHDDTFAAKGHLAKLRGPPCNIAVRVVRAPGDMVLDGGARS